MTYPVDRGHGESRPHVHHRRSVLLAPTLSGGETFTAIHADEADR